MDLQYPPAALGNPSNSHCPVQNLQALTIINALDKAEGSHGRFWRKADLRNCGLKCPGPGRVVKELVLGTDVSTKRDHLARDRHPLQDWERPYFAKIPMLYSLPS